MADLIFRCSSCGKSLVVDQSGIGATCQCSDCHNRVSVPQPVLRFRCPFCNSELLSPDQMGEELFVCPSCETGIPVPSLVRIEYDRDA